MAGEEERAVKRMFIGGCADGKAIEVGDDPPFFRVPHEVPFFTFPPDCTSIPVKEWAFQYDSYEYFKMNWAICHR